MPIQLVETFSLDKSASTKVFFLLTLLFLSEEMSLYDDFLFDDDSFVVVYTDGACFNNGRWNAAAGLGVVFNYEHSA